MNQDEFVNRCCVRIVEIMLKESEYFPVAAALKEYYQKYNEANHILLNKIGLKNIVEKNLKELDSDWKNSYKYNLREIEKYLITFVLQLYYGDNSKVGKFNRILITYNLKQ